MPINRQEVQRAKAMLAKVVPFDVWMASNAWSKDEIDMYWFTVNSIKQVAQMRTSHV